MKRMKKEKLENKNATSTKVFTLHWHIFLLLFVKLGEEFWCYHTAP